MAAQIALTLPSCSEHLISSVLTSLLELTEYNAWANQILLECLDQHCSYTKQISLILSHIAAATFNWVQRIQGESTALDLWDMMPLETAKRCLLRDQRLIEKASHSIPSAFKIIYKNSLGVEFENTFEQIVLHLVNHNSYHRGQIAEELIRLRIEPPTMDLIAFFRNR